MIIAGHGRVLAARKLGLTDIPVMIAANWSEAQKRAYVLADNKIALNAGWDEALLRLELTDLSGMGVDLNLIGFTEGEFAALTASNNPGLTDPDDSPEPPVTPVSRLGDVWLLGRHRLMCGDCTDAGTSSRRLSLAWRRILMVTDPPYGVAYDPAWRKRLGLNGEGAAMGQVMNDDRADWREAWALFPGDVAYVWHGGLHAGEVADESRSGSGFDIRARSSGTRRVW
jgi:hypothetical protein